MLSPRFGEVLQYGEYRRRDVYIPQPNLKSLEYRQLGETQMEANVLWENTECGSFCFGRHRREWLSYSEEKTLLTYSTTVIH